MGYAFNAGIAGAPQPSDIFVPDTTARFPLGMLVDGVDPFFGYGEFMYLKNQNASIGVGRVVTIADQTFVTADMANTANLGHRVLTSAAAMAANTYGWFRTRGAGPWSCTASVAAGVAFGMTAAGQVGTNAAGKQILNAKVLQPSTYAPTKANCQTTLSTAVKVPDLNGLFVGLAVSGTGIPGGATIAGLDSSQNTIVLSAAATAVGTVTLTFTWTGFLLVDSGGAFTQGAIT